MKAAHHINPYTSHMTDLLSALRFSTLFVAASAASSSLIVSHSLYQEEALQSAIIDWLIVKDVSFQNASPSEFQGLIT